MKICRRPKEGHCTFFLSQSHDIGNVYLLNGCIQKNVYIFVPTPDFFITGITLISILPAYKCQIGKSMMICVIFLWRAKAGANTEI